MNDIKMRLCEELDNLEHQQKVESGLILTETDVRYIFRILKENDQELKPLFEVIESMMLSIKKENYFLMEDHIRNLLKFYNIIPNDNFIGSRHKLFFTETKQLVKKSFFGRAAIDKVKAELEIENIFKKIQ